MGLNLSSVDSNLDSGEVIRPEQVELLDADGQPLPEQAPPRDILADVWGFIRRTPVTSAVIALNIAIYLIFNVQLHKLPDKLIFSPPDGQIFPQIITYMFAHANGMHIGFNVIVILSFGWVVERIYGPWRYSVIYFVGGILAALAQYLVYPEAALLGASGAASAVLAVFVRHFPNARVYLFMVVPVPAWLAIFAIIAMNVYGGITGGIQGSVVLEPNIGYIPHLAGLLAGILLSLLLLPPKRGAQRWVLRSRRP